MEDDKPAVQVDGDNPVLASQENFQTYNNADRPGNYVGKRRAKSPGEDTRVNLESDNPTVFLVVETIAGLGDSVIAASMSFKAAVVAAKRFAEPIEGEITPERVYLPTAGSVRMRLSDGTASPYRIDPLELE